MKKLSYGGLFLALVGIIFIGCKKIEKNQNSIDNQLSEARRVGIVHNEGLADFYNALTQLKNERNSFKKISESDLHTLMEKSVVMTMANNDYKLNDSIRQDIKNSLNFNKEKSELSNEEFINQFNSFSANLKSKYLLLLNGLDQTKNSKEVVALTSTIRSNMSNLNDLEKIQLEVALSTADYSYKYWEENLDSWVSLFSGNPNTPIPASICGKCIAKKDVSGAIGGAVGGAVVGSFAGGVGAVPGAVAGAVGGAIAGSVSEAVEELWDWFWS